MTSPTPREKLERERVQDTPRKPIPQRDREAMFADQQGLCADCQAETPLGNLEGDHVIPIKLGGKHRRSNWQLLCVPCHKVKTRKDRKDIAKALRRAAKDRGEFPASKFKLRGRSFQLGRNKTYDLSKN